MTGAPAVRGMARMSTARAILGLALLCLASCRTFEYSPRPGGAPEAEAVLARQQVAWNEGDLETFVELGYWKSSRLTFFSGGTVTRGYDGLMERYRKSYGGGDRGKLAFADLESQRLGPEAALVRGRWELTFQNGETRGGLFTLILLETLNGWRITHDHTSEDAAE